MNVARHCRDVLLLEVPDTCTLSVTEALTAPVEFLFPVLDESVLLEL